MERCDHCRPVYVQMIDSITMKISYTVRKVYVGIPLNNGHIGDERFPLFRDCPFFGGRNVRTIYKQGANSLPIVGSCPLFGGKKCNI